MGPVKPLNQVVWLEVDEVAVLDVVVEAWYGIEGED